MICVKFPAFCDLRADLRIRLATRCKSIPKFWFCKLALTCVDLPVRLARALGVPFWDSLGGFNSRKFSQVLFITFGQTC